MPGSVSAMALASVYASPGAVIATPFAPSFSRANRLMISQSSIICRKYGLPIRREL